ncbi:sulfate ABC transporter permease subunit CysT [Azospirillum sp. RWY-5-1]|uniref:Sulfate transport system permease protein CysT n=1 Tax=Azospirillum oleiclasticum TaxID=2735135 RepID=A0ABX2TKM3_9PROT|nr:sulfate ABC transporter permease subunit CysT [Azospirillum oleiclasticum]NYZ24582.1 sulfate ABC transporter permease subunit CysT [Azospirillum oleiclasticum]
MSSSTVEPLAGTPAAARRRPRSVLPGFGLTLGCTLLFLALVVALPLAALLMKSAALGWADFLAVVGSPRALATYRVTVGAALAATLFNMAFGLLIAWILVRYEFPGRRALDALVDLPFALPTAVAGIALTGLFAGNGWFGQFLEPLGIKVAHSVTGIAVAMAFTSVPFVVRTVQPVLEDMDPELEEAARSLGATERQVFARVVFPVILPAWLAGGSLAFARSLGEFGAIIFIAGNLPFRTEITALLAFIRLEEFDYSGAAAIATVMLLAAFLLLVLVNLLQAWQLRYLDKTP